jgi:hypothetical protein
MSFGRHFHPPTAGSKIAMPILRPLAVESRSSKRGIHTSKLILIFLRICGEKPDSQPVMVTPIAVTCSLDCTASTPTSDIPYALSIPMSFLWLDIQTTVS